MLILSSPFGKSLGYWDVYTPTPVVEQQWAVKMDTDTSTHDELLAKWSFGATEVAIVSPNGVEVDLGATVVVPKNTKTFVIQMAHL